MAISGRDFAWAREELEAALKQDPGNREYESNLKLVLERLGEKKKAQSPW